MGLHQDWGCCGQGSHVGNLCVEAVGHCGETHQDGLREVDLSACDPRRLADSGGYSVTHIDLVRAVGPDIESHRLSIKANQRRLRDSGQPCKPYEELRLHLSECLSDKETIKRLNQRSIPQDGRFNGTHTTNSLSGFQPKKQSEKPYREPSLEKLNQQKTKERVLAAWSV